MRITTTKIAVENVVSTQFNSKVITSTQFRRPDYTGKMLKHLSKCKGIEDYLLLISIDGDNQEVLDLCCNFNFCGKKIFLRSTPLGCNQNTSFVLSQGFRLSDYVIHVEDDILLSERALEIFEELYYHKKEDIFSVSLYNRLGYDDIKENDKNLVLTRPGFIPWGFALWRDSFDKIKDRFVYDSDTSRYLSWDLQINNYCIENNLKNLYTKFSRIDNIGALGGVHVPSAQWHAENHRVPFWANMVNDESKSLNIVT